MKKLKQFLLSLFLVFSFIQMSWSSPLQFSSGTLRSTHPLKASDIHQLKELDINDLMGLNVQNGVITCLDLSNSEMGDEVVILLAEWLKKSSSFNDLTQIILQDCNM